MATATITGMVLWAGESAPKARRLRIQGDDTCTAAHPTPVSDPKTLVDAATGGIPNALIFVKSGHERWSFDPPDAAVLVNQKGCMYIPHTFGIQIGQKLEIRSDDATQHNVHLVSRRQSKPMNQSQRQGQILNYTFKRKETKGAYLKCDIHSWMRSNFGVFDHPFFAVSGKDGSFSIKVPPGEYQVEVWHENKKWKAAAKTQKVTVDKEDTQTIDFKFSGR